MSHSQFHLYKQFILGHAWLNLLDKHMTTGRINQVTLVASVLPVARSDHPRGSSEGSRRLPRDRVVESQQLC